MKAFNKFLACCLNPGFFRPALRQLVRRDGDDYNHTDNNQLGVSRYSDRIGNFLIPIRQSSYFAAARGTVMSWRSDVGF